MSDRGNSPSGSPMPWTAILTFLGVVIPALLVYLGGRSQILIPLQATQTAEALRTPESRGTSFAPTSNQSAPTEMVLPSATVFKSPIAPINITLTNQDCVDQDYYVDGQFITKVAADAAGSFQVSPGQHSIRACNAGTTACGSSIQLKWLQSTTALISRGTGCPEATITLTNQDCADQDYYVDGQFITKVAAGATTSFQVTPGQHLVRACNADTNTCGSSVQLNWSQSMIATISRHLSCP